MSCDLLLWRTEYLRSYFGAILDIDTQTPQPTPVAAVAVVCWVVGWFGDWTEIILQSPAPRSVSLSGPCSVFRHLALAFWPGPQGITSAVHKPVSGQHCARTPRAGQVLTLYGDSWVAGSCCQFGGTLESSDCSSLTAPWGRQGDSLGHHTVFQPARGQLRSCF